MIIAQAEASGAVTEMPRFRNFRDATLAIYGTGESGDNTSSPTYDVVEVDEDYFS